MNRLMCIPHPIGLSISVYYHVEEVTKLAWSKCHFSHTLFLKMFNDGNLPFLQCRYMYNGILRKYQEKMSYS